MAADGDCSCETPRVWPSVSTLLNIWPHNDMAACTSRLALPHRGPFNWTADNDHDVTCVTHWYGSEQPASQSSAGSFTYIYIVRLFTTKVEQFFLMWKKWLTDRQTITHNAKLWEAKSYNEIYNTDNLKYSKMAECLSLADVAKPYFSRSFVSSQCLNT